MNKMTDRELLEAAGYWCAEFNCPDRVPLNWNPLKNDGDALRLAVMLRLDVDCEHDPIAVGRDEIGVREPWGVDPYAATRRAIVRAAAALTEA